MPVVPVGPLSLPFPLIKLLGHRLLPGVTLFGQTQEKVVALTLDDGPHPTLTPAVVDALARNNAHATFFLIGSRADDHPHPVRAIVAGEHEIGNHTWDVKRSSGLPLAKLQESVGRTHELLSSFTTEAVTLFRPGSGFVNETVREVAAEYRYTTVLGSIYPHDVRVPWTSLIIKDVVNNVRPGSIIVLHEGKSSRWCVIHVLDEVLRRLASKGFRVTTVSKLLALDAR